MQAEYEGKVDFLATLTGVLREWQDSAGSNGIAPEDQATRRLFHAVLSNFVAVSDIVDYHSGAVANDAILVEAIRRLHQSVDALAQLAAGADR